MPLSGLTAQSGLVSAAGRVVVGWVMRFGSFAGRAPRAVAAAVVVPKVFGPGLQDRVEGRRAGARTRPRAAPGRPPPHRVGGDQGGHRSSAWAACRKARSALVCSRPAAPACQAALRPGRRRRRATAGRLTARPGRIGWQVLLMLARDAGCARVTKQYELVCKAEISPIARRGTSGLEGRPLPLLTTVAGDGPKVSWVDVGVVRDPAQVAAQRDQAGARPPIDEDPMVAAAGAARAR